MSSQPKRLRRPWLLRWELLNNRDLDARLREHPQVSPRNLAVRYDLMDPGEWGNKA